MQGREKLGLWVAVLVLAGASVYNFVQARNLNDASRSIEALEKKAADLALSDENIRWNMASDAVDEKLRNSKWTVMETANRSFSPIDTYIGAFLVSVDDVKPYPGGYRVSLSLGNITSADVMSSTVTARWGGRDLWFDERKDGTKEQSFDIVKPLRSGAWTKVSIDLVPASEDDISTISIALHPNTALLPQTR